MLLLLFVVIASLYFIDFLLLHVLPLLLLFLRHLRLLAHVAFDDVVASVVSVVSGSYAASVVP